jgi:hypothetical protein
MANNNVQSNLLQRNILSDCASTIQLVQFNIISSRVGAPLRNRRLFSDIINALPDGIEIIIITNDEDYFSMCTSFCANINISCVMSPANTNISVWAQDPYLVLGGEMGEVLLGSRAFDRIDDKLIPQAIATHIGCKYMESLLSFEGGNIVSDECYVYIGANTIMQNARRLQVDKKVIISQFEKELGKIVVMLGPYPQPMGHIDTIITPLGNKTLVIADPEMGVEIARQALADVPDEITSMEQRFEASFFSDGCTQLQMPDGSWLQSPDIVGRTQEAIKDSLDLVLVLNRLVVNLERNGFKIYRMPFLYKALPSYAEVQSTQGGSQSPEVEVNNAAPDPRHGSQFPCFSYNNVLLDKAGDQLVVYVPQYGWPSLDNAACQKWRSLGYHPEPIPGFSTASMFGGQLRCMTKVIRRKPEQ